MTGNRVRKKRVAILSYTQTRDLVVKSPVSNGEGGH